MTFPSSIKPFGWLEAWMSERKNVIRFLLARFLLMTVLVLAFSILYLSQS